MAVTLKVENDGQGLVYTHSGLMEGEYLADLTRKHYENIALESVRYQIMDFTGVDRIEMSTEQLQDTAQQFCEASKRLMPNHKFAIILKKNSMAAIFKMWELYSKNAQVKAKIFYDLGDARAWIESSEP